MQRVTEYLNNLMFTVKKNINLIANSNHRTVFFGAGLFALVVLLLVTHLVVSGFDSETQLAERDSLNLSRVIAQDASAAFEKIDLMLKDVNRVFEFSGRKNWDAKSYSALLGPIAADVAGLKAIKILNADGFYIGESDGSGTLPIANNSDRSYYQALKNNPDLELAVSEPVISKTAKIWVIVLARRLYTPDKKFGGVILATVSVDHFAEQFSHLNIGSNGNVTMISLKDRNLLSRFPRKENRIGKVFNISSDWEKSINDTKDSGNIFTISNADKLMKTFGYAKSSKYDFIIMVGLAEKDYLASWYTRSIFLVLSYLIGIFCLFRFSIKYLSSLEDIENQKLKLVEASKMASLGEMAGGVAHEVNNPLAIIKGQVFRIQRILENSSVDPKTALPLVSSIDKTVERIVKIVTGLKSFSRQSDQDPKLECSLSAIVESSLSLCAEKFKENSVRLVVNQIPDVTINCRETQISQVLINLLSNAFDASSDVRDKWIEISFKQEKGMLQIFVTDSGAGIPSDLEKKIMQPFFTTKPVGKGTGLGLSISKGIIEDHNGHLYLNSSAKNTQFVCDLPIVKKMAA